MKNYLIIAGVVGVGLLIGVAICGFKDGSAAAPAAA